MDSRKLTRAFLIVAIVSPILITCQSRGEQYRGSTNNGYLRGLPLSQSSQSQYRPNQEFYQQQSQVQSFNTPIYNEPTIYNPSQQYPQAPPFIYNTQSSYDSRPEYPNQPPQYPQTQSNSPQYPQPQSNPSLYQKPQSNSPQYPQSQSNPPFIPQNTNNKPYDQPARYPQTQTQSQQTYIQQSPLYNRPSYNARPDSNTHLNTRPPQTQTYNNVQSQQNPHSSLDSRFSPEDTTTPEVFTNRPTKNKVRPPTPTSRPPDFDNRFDDRDSIKKKLSFDGDLSTSMEVFGLELLQQFNARFPEDNFMISPFSVYHLLVLIAEGAQGSTFDELNRELNLKSLERTRDFQQYLNVALAQNTADIVLKKFAMLVTDLNRPIENSYETTLDKVYDADVVPVNFLNVDRTLSTINGMVSNLTDGQIKDTVEKDDLLKAQLILISGLFFQGKWANVFNTTFTKQEQFFDTNGNPIGTVNMMFQRGPFAYSAVGDLGCHVLELPYAEAPFASRNSAPTSGLSMILVLPRKGLSLDDAIVNVHKHGMEKIYRELYNAKVEYEDDEVEVHLPRFEITTSQDIKETLSALGINAIFDQSRADLSKINKKSFVSSMIHKTKISVDEKGTTAAAVTTSIFANKATPPKFHANKPFLFFIVDRVTKLILFSGQYASPELF